MKLTDYKTALKGHEALVSAKADEAFAQDWRIGAIGALNHALAYVPIAVNNCTNENTANAVLQYCDRKAGK